MRAEVAKVRQQGCNGKELVSKLTSCESELSAVRSELEKLRAAEIERLNLEREREREKEREAHKDAEIERLNLEIARLSQELAQREGDRDRDMEAHKEAKIERKELMSKHTSCESELSAVRRELEKERAAGKAAVEDLKAVSRDRDDKAAEIAKLGAVVGDSTRGGITATPKEASGDGEAGGGERERDAHNVEDAEIERLKLEREREREREREAHKDAEIERLNLEIARLSQELANSEHELQARQIFSKVKALGCSLYQVTVY
jgi:DNA repair exonuclease SbcCD ATPase subunit